MARSSTTFKLGNKAAVGGRGPSRPDVCTQVLLSQLHEIDRTTKKEKIHLLCEQLLKLALGYKYKTLDKNGKRIEVEMQPDLGAIKEIFDRVQGRAPLSITHTDNTLDDIPDETLIKDVVKDLIARGLPVPEGLLDDDAEDEGQVH